jgi:poly(A) polymerase
MIHKKYSSDEHGINLEAVDPDALSVIFKLQEAGYIAYLVGGSVRDLLLGQTPKDYDISTSAKPEEIKRLFRNSLLIGRRFRLAHIRFGKKIFEVSTFRSGDNELDELIVRDNEWGDPEEDVTRRDFTINGLFYNPSNETVIDYVEGYADIKQRCLRTIGQPYVRFKQDPVRMIRLLKFQARLGFEVHKETQVALLECRGEILKSSQARILEELLRMLESGAAEPFFRLMIDSGLLQLLLPAVASFLEKKEGSKILLFLHELDLKINRENSYFLDRSVPLSCLVFPLFQHHIHVRYLNREKIPHLGEVHRESLLITDEAFGPFFLIPRRARIMVSTILTAQYRLTPPDRKRGLKPRIPNDPDFNLALKFLELRSCVNPSLKGIWEEWQAVFKSPASQPLKIRSRKRKG